MAKGGKVINGMRVVDTMVKHFRGVDMTFLLYRIDQRDKEAPICGEGAP